MNQRVLSRDAKSATPDCCPIFYIYYPHIYIKDKCECSLSMTYTFCHSQNFITFGSYMIPSRIEELVQPASCMSLWIYFPRLKADHGETQSKSLLNCDLLPTRRRVHGEWRKRRSIPPYSWLKNTSGWQWVGVFLTSRDTRAETI